MNPKSPQHGVISRPLSNYWIDGVVIFMILSVAEEVCAIVCSSLPVIGPQLFLTFKRDHSSRKLEHSSSSSKFKAIAQSRTCVSKGFQRLAGGPLGHAPDSQQTLHRVQRADWPCAEIPLNTVTAETMSQHEDLSDTGIVVRKEVQVSRASK